jgi:hypothetical protein
VEEKDRATLFRHSITHRATLFTRSQLRVLRALDNRAECEPILRQIQSFQDHLPRILQLNEQFTSLLHAYAQSQCILGDERAASLGACSMTASASSATTSVCPTSVDSASAPGMGENNGIDGDRIIAAVIEAHCQSLEYAITWVLDCD